MAEGSWIRISAIKANLNARTVNDIIEKALGKRAISITQMPDLRQEIGEEFVVAVSPFVPMKSGQLISSGRATDDGRVYWSATNRGFNYASTVYDEDGERWGPEGYKKPTTPNSYPRWVEKVQPGTAEWEAFINNITPIIKEAFRNE
jgi:hypothetical protein